MTDEELTAAVQYISTLAHGDDGVHFVAYVTTGRVLYGETWCIGLGGRPWKGDAPIIALAIKNHDREIEVIGATSIVSLGWRTP